MTVLDCYKMIVSTCGIYDPVFGGHLSNLPPAHPARSLVDWLHGLSSERMAQRYGEDWGWHPDLPKNIDSATVLTPEQLAEFDRKFHSLPNE